MKNSTLLFCSFIFLVGNILATDQALGQRYIEKKNIPYVIDGGERQQLDLYLPLDYEKSEETYPVLLVIHGGGWSAGDKSHATGWAHHYVPLGFVVVGINYRLQPKFPMPAQIIDCKSAVRWLRAHAHEYKIDAKHFGAWGHSAGGHLSSLLAVLGDSKEFDQGEYLEQSSAIQAVCDYCGPSDFIAWAKDKPEQEGSYKKLFGGTPEEKRELIEKMSPVRHVSAKTPPILIVHAIDDELVPFSQSEKLHAAMQKVGAKSRLIALQEGDGGHSAKSFNSEEIRQIVQRFFEQTLKKVADKTEMGGK